MSKPYRVNSKWLRIRKRRRRYRSQEEAKFMSFFGATDLCLKNLQGIDNISATYSSGGLGSSWDVPLSSAEPLPSELAPIPLPAPESAAGEACRRSRDVILPPKRESTVPALASGAGCIEQHDQDTRVNELEELIEFLGEKGHKVAEVKALPAGITRITVEDLLSKKNVREPELVKVGG